MYLLHLYKVMKRHKPPDLKYNVNYKIVFNPVPKV
jgi:hypothetical protein